MRSMRSSSTQHTDFNMAKHSACHCHLLSLFHNGPNYLQGNLYEKRIVCQMHGTEHLPLIRRRVTCCQCRDNSREKAAVLIRGSHLQSRPPGVNCGCFANGEAILRIALACLLDKRPCLILQREICRYRFTSQPPFSLCISQQAAEVQFAHES